MQRVKWILRFLARSAMILIALFLLFYILIQLPKVQTWLVQKATTNLSKRLDTKVAIKSVDIEFFKTAVLEGIYIEDQKGDTLLYSNQLKVNVSLFSFLEKELNLNQIHLSGATVHLSRMETDSLYNYEFLLGDKTSSSKEIENVDTTSNINPWNINLGNLLLEDVRFNMLDYQPDGFELVTAIELLDLQTKDIDLTNKSLNINKLLLENSKVSYNILKESNDKVDEDSPLNFPNLGWDVKVDEIIFTENHIKYSNSNEIQQPKVVDFSHLDLDGVSLTINDLSLKENNINADIQNGKLIDHSGFQIKLLEGQVALTDKDIIVNNFTLLTPSTSLKNEMSFSFQKFGDLKDFSNKVKTSASILPSQVAYQDLWKLVPAFRDIPSVRTDLQEKINLSGNIIFEKDRLTLKKLNGKISDNLIVQADGAISQLTTKPLFDVSIQKISSDYATIDKLTRDLNLPIGVEKWGQINIAGNVVGTVDDLTVTDFDFTTSGKTQLQGDVALQGLPDIEKLKYQTKIKNVTTEAEELRGFSASPLPPFLDTLGVFSFQGDFAGTTLDFDVNGDFQTSVGDLKTNLDLKFQSNYETASYDGKLDLVDFDLAPILGKDFGKASFVADLKGDGLKLDDFDNNLDAIIPSIEYKNYIYKNLKIDGTFIKKKFEGKANIQDENIAVDFFGKVDLNDSLPILNVIMQVDTINLQQLNLYKRELGVSGLFRLDLEGDNFDNLKGSAGINEFELSQDGRTYETEKKISLRIKEKVDNEKTILFRSAFMEAKLNGDFTYQGLTNSLISFVDEFISIKDLIGRPTNDSLYALEPVKEIFDFDFKFKNITDFTQVFIPELTGVDTARLVGNFNNVTKELQFDGMFPNIQYAGFAADTLQLISNTKNDALDIDVLVRNGSSDNLFAFPYGEFQTSSSNDSLSFEIDIWDKIVSDVDTIRNQKLLLGGVLTEMNKVFDLSLTPNFILNDRTWRVGQQNKIVYEKPNLIIRDLGLFKDGQAIEINSKGSAPNNDFSPIDINFEHFNISEISELLGVEKFYWEGDLNGNVMLKEPVHNLHYNSKLMVDSLMFNNEDIGLLELEVVQAVDSKKMNVDVLLSKNNDAKVNGTYDLENNIFDLDFDIKKLTVGLFDPFVKGLIQDSKGYVEGELEIQGSPTEPIVKGALNARDFNTLVILSNTRYSADEIPVQITERVIQFQPITLKDPGDNSATLTGKIDHEYFQDLNLDLLFNTNSFQILNTTDAENELYYGKLFVKADVKISGPLELPSLNVSASTLPNTELFVQPFLETQIIEQEDYIIFANPNDYNVDSLLLIEEKIGQNSYSFDLSLNLEVTKDAVLNILIDAETGDNLTSIGTANLSIRINPKGDISVVGDYIIDNGKYLLNYEQLVKREFEIQKGSNLAFSGDPLQAKFDIKAVYKVRTTLQDLIKDEATAEELKSAGIRQDVNVMLMISGNLEEPIITFDIEVPDSSGDIVSSSVSNRLSTLRNNPSDLNTQVFGLLFFNAFVVSDQNIIGNASENIALSSVGKLLSNQLNKLASKYIKGVEVNFDLESYRSGLLQENTVTQVQVQLSKKLFNDRLNIKVGTNVNLDANSSQDEQSGLSNVAGDFVLEYRLTSQGSYYVTVFHKSDFNILEDANASKSGAGFIYRKSFNGKKYKQ